jgi:hypothetical protein
MGALPREEKKLDGLRKNSDRFYLQELQMVLIEWKRFQDKWRNFTVYEMIRSILFAQSLDDIY